MPSAESSLLETPRSDKGFSETKRDKREDLKGHSLICK